MYSDLYLCDQGFAQLPAAFNSPLSKANLWAKEVKTWVF